MLQLSDQQSAKGKQKVVDGTLTSIEGLQRGESSKGRKRAREAIRYASRTPEQIQARRERDRARRQNLTPEEKEEINARRREKRQRMTLDERNASQRARRQSLTPEERQERNARQRARRHSLPPEERHMLLAQRNARYASRRDTPCMDSIVLECPTGLLKGDPSLSSYAFSCPSTLTQTFSTVQGNLGSTAEAMEDDHIVFTSKGAANTAQCKEPTSVQCPASASVDSSSLDPDDPDDSICSGSPTESFNVVVDNSQITEEEEDDEYFAFAGRVDNEDCDDVVDAFTTDNIAPDPYDRVYQNIPDCTHTLAPKPDCKHCGAKRFQYETNGFCCQSGKIKLAQSEPPLELQMLYTSSDRDAVHFRDNIRYFNGHFSFTTLGVSLDNRYTNMRSGVYTFRAQGQIYHNVFSFGPTQDGPKHLELYFYDDDPGLQHRFRRSPNLDRDVIRRLVDILKDNPYSETFRNLGGVDDLEEYRIELNTDMRLDQRRYNLPISSEVAAVWVEGNELCKHFERSIVLFGNDNKRYSIQPYYGCYDPLSYPLFFPRGEIGWHPGIPKNGVSLNEILQSRRNGRQKPDKEKEGRSNSIAKFTKNIVYKEVLNV